MANDNASECQARVAEYVKAVKHWSWLEEEHWSDQPLSNIKHLLNEDQIKKLQDTHQGNYIDDYRMVTDMIIENTLELYAKCRCAVNLGAHKVVKSETTHPDWNS